MTDPSPIAHRHVTANGIDLHVAELGEGPPVILCHGFPELWYSWRHQLPALAGAGFRALAPDLRGYGESSIPENVEDYDVLSVTADLIALLDEIGHEQAVFVGHDWGAVVWQLALAHPQRVRAVVGMSVPFVPRAPAPPLELMRQAWGEDFYIVWFQQPGMADRELARDVRRTLTATVAWGPGWAQGDDRARRPAWMSQEDLETYAETYERTGFTGGLNYYRNIDRNWRLTASLDGNRVEQPSLFITGSRDPVQAFMPTQAMEGWVTDLRVVVVEGAGHWVQQERPGDVNGALLSFLDELGW